MSLLRAITPFKGKAVAFSPAVLPGLNLWLDDADATTLTLDGSNRILAWKDKSKTAATFTSANGGNPLQQTVSGHPEAYFDSSSNQIISSTNTPLIYTGFEGFTVAVVITPSDVTLPLFMGLNTDYAPSTIQNTPLCFITTSNPAYNDIYMSSNNNMSGSTQPCFQAATPNGYSTDINNKRVALIYRYNGSGWDQTNTSAFKFYLNSAPLTFAIDPNQFSQQTADAIGGIVPNGNKLTGGIHEVIVCQNISDATFDQLYNYLSVKWSL